MLFLNVSSITKVILSTTSTSRMITFTPGSRNATVKFRDHDNTQWVSANEQTISLTNAYTGSSTLNIWLCSDTHVGKDASHKPTFESAISDIESAATLDYVFHMGDMGDNGGNSSHMDDYVTARATSSVPTSKWYEIAGNHEYNGETFPTYYFATLGYDSLWYSFDIDNIHCIFLSDTTVDNELSTGAFQYLEEELERYINTGNIVIVATHALVPNCGLLGATNTTLWTMLPAATVESYATTYADRPIDIWLCGHYHDDPTSTSHLVYNTPPWAKADTIPDASVFTSWVPADKRHTYGTDYGTGSRIVYGDNVRYGGGSSSIVAGTFT